MWSSKALGFRNKLRRLATLKRQPSRSDRTGLTTCRPRTLHLESLEERSLLSVSILPGASAYAKPLSVGFDGVLSLPGDSSESGTRQRIFDLFNGTWSDAEKDATSTEDDLLCWAATASNMLEYTGWGLVNGMTKSDQMLDYFENHWQDVGELTQNALTWWFDGKGTYGGDVDVAGGGFYPGFNPSTYVHVESNNANILSFIRSYTTLGSAMGIWIHDGFSHEITCWGYNYDPALQPSDPAYYKGLWVTDSDDDKGVANAYTAPNHLHYYSVTWDSADSRWMMNDYAPGTMIEEAVSLDRYSNGNVTFNGDQDSVGQNDAINLALDTTGMYLQVRLNGTLKYSSPMSQVKQLNLFGWDGNDTLTVDYSHGNPIPSGGINYDGGTQGASPGDSLAILGTGTQHAVYYPDSVTTGNGRMVIDGSTINFTGLSPISVSGLAEYTLVTPNSSDVLTVDSPAAGQNRVSGTSGGVNIESTTFTNVTDFRIDAATNDSSGAGNDTITIAANSVATGLQSLTVDTGSGNDILTVDSTNALFSVSDGIHYDGGTGFDQLKLIQTGGATQTSDKVVIGVAPGSGESIITGPSNTQTVYFEGLEPITDNVSATTFNITSIPGLASQLQADNDINYEIGQILGPTAGRVTVDDFEPIEFTNKDNLVIDTGAGSDEINLNNTSTPTGLTGITVNGGDPTGSDTLIVNGTAVAGTVSVDVSAQTILGVAGAGVTVTYGTIEHLTVVAGVSTTLSVSGSSSLVGVDYTLTPGSTADRGDIATIAVPISFIGFGAGKTLNFVGDTIDGNDVLTILGTNQNDSFSVAGTTGAVTYTGRANITQSDIDELVIDGLNGDDQFTVAGNHPYDSVAIHGNNPSASDVLSFNGSGAGAVTVDLAAQTVTEAGFSSVDFTGVEILNANANSQNLFIQATTGDDTLTVTPTDTNAVTAQLNASSPSIGASPVVNGSNIDTLNVDMLGGNDQLTVNGTQIGETITVNGTLVTVGALETVNYANTEHLQVNGLAGNDTFDVTPSANTSIFVDGGDPIGNTAGDAIVLHPPGAFSIEPGPENDKGGLNAAGVQRVSWDHIEAVTVVVPPGGGPVLILGTNGEDEITIIARDSSYNVLADGVQDFTVSVNDGPNFLFINEPALFVDALAGDDDIVLREPAPNNAVWDVDVTIAGGPPAAVTGDSGDVFELETPGNQTVIFTPTGIDTATLDDTTNSSLITLTASFTIPAIPYTSSPGGIEQVIYDGQSGSDNLTVQGTAGDDTIVHIPGALDNAGTFRVNSLLGLDYQNLGTGSVLTVDGQGGTNTLIAIGTTANDLFQVDATTGTVHLNARQPIAVTAIQNLTLVGLTGDDIFKVSAPLPLSFTNITIEGDDPSASDIVNLTGATGSVTVNLADSTLPTDTTITGYGATVTLTGVEVANLDANSNSVSVVGTSQNDKLTYTPSGAAAGSFQNAGLNTVFNVSGVTGNLTVFGGSGGNADEVVVRGTAARDLFKIDQGTAVATVLANNVTALLPVQLGTNVPILTAQGLGGQDTFQVTPGAGIGAFPLDNLLINVDGGGNASGENNALVIQSATGGPLAANQFVVVNRGATVNSGTVRTFTAAVQWPDINYVNVQVVSPNVASTDGNLLIMGPDLNEPNEFQANAAFVGSGSTLQIQHASIFPNFSEFPGVPSDNDYYRVVAQTTGTLDFQVYFKLFNPALLPAGGNLNLEVLDVNGNIIATAPGTFGALGTTANARVRIPAVAGQSYFLHVFGQLPPPIEGQPQPSAVINGYDVTIIDTPPPVPQNLELDDVVISDTVAVGPSSSTSFSGNAAITSPAGGTLSTVNGFYNGRYLTITSGPLTGQRVTITAYVGATQTFTVSPGLSAAPTAGTAFLIESIDTGRSQNDNVTRINTPTIFIRLDDGIFLHDLPGNPANDTPPAGVITIPFQGASLLPGYRIAVFDEGSTPPQNGTPPQTPLGFAVATGQEGVYTFTTPALTDGSHFLTARVQMIDPAGAPNPNQTGFGDRSLALEVFVDTRIPPAFFGLISQADTTQGLDAASDSGVLGDPNLPATFTDRITNDKTPTLYGAAEADAIIDVYLETNGIAGLQSGGTNPDTFLGKTVAIPLDGTNQFPNGQWSYTVTRDLNDPLLGLGIDGLRTFYATGEDPAGNVTADANADSLQIFLDTTGPQITNVQITGSPGFNLFGLKSGNASQGPTPLVYSLTISVQDLPDRVAAFLYNALAADATDPQNPAEDPGNYLLVGDASGVIQITSIQFNPVTVAGSPATGTLVLTFANPLPDDRFTLTVKDSVVDPAGNKLDGESNAIEPNGAPNFPSGDGQPGGNFVARFTVDSRPEIGTWSGGSEYIDTNGNFIFDPTNTDAVNRDLTYTLGFTSDEIFAGNFGFPYINEAGTPNGFSKLAAYGKDSNGNYRWMFLDDTGSVITTIIQPANTNGKPFNALPVAGNFDGNAANGDEVGLFDGTNWYFDTNHNGFIDAGDFHFSGAIKGYPIVGDFDGDGHIDLGTYHDGVFYFQLWNSGLGNYNSTVQTFSLFGTGLPQLGALTRPVAADMDQDGIADIGVYTPDGSGATGTSASEWYWFVSNFVEPTPGTVTVFSSPGRKFTQTPLGNDIFAKFGNTYAMPIVGNFDPPLSVQSGRLTQPKASLSAPDVNLSGTTTYTFKVTYSDDAAVNVSSINGSDIVVSGPNGFSQAAELVSVDNSSNGTPRTATYRVNKPGGTWASGTYTVTMRPNEVSDANGNYVSAEILGTFTAKAFSPSFTLNGPTSGSYAPGQNITITWTAADVSANDVITLCLDTDTTLWNGNEKWIEIDKVAATNGSGSYSFDPTGFAPGTYYVGGYMYDKVSYVFTNAHLTAPITIPPQTFALSGPTSGTYAPGHNITIAWKAGNVSANDVITLCLDTDTTLWNGNERWIEIDKVAAANGNGSYTFDPTGFAPGTYYVGGYMYDKVSHVFTNAQPTAPITIPPQTFALSGPTSGTYAPGQNITITWTAGNVSAKDVITLCLDTDATLWNGNEKWIEIDKVAAANGNGSYSFDPSGFAPGTYYVGGYMYDKVTHIFTNSHLTAPITIPAPTFALTGPTSGTYAPGQSMTIKWTAANVSANSVITLCLDTDTTLWNGNDHWIEIDKAAASNGNGSYTFNLTGFAPGTYYVGGYMYDKTLKSFTNSHLMQSIIIGSGSSQSQSSALLVSANAEGNPTGMDGASLVDSPSNLAVATKDLVFSSARPAAANFTQPATDVSGANNQVEENILAQADAKEELAAIDKVLQDQDAWLEQPSGNWLA